MYGAKLLEQQSTKLLELQTANDEYEKRQSLCEKRWADLLDENQRNNEALVQLRMQLENQRDTYTKLLGLTEKRVIQANRSISQMFAQEQGNEAEAKKKAAEYLAE